MNRAMGYNDEASTLIYREYDASKKPAVTFFSDADCSGLTSRFFAPDDKSDRSWISALWGHAVGDNSIDSIMIPPGLQV
jgi:hypothetical protein